MRKVDPIMLYPTTVMALAGLFLIIDGAPVVGALIVALGVSLTANAVRRLRRQA